MVLQAAKNAQNHLQISLGPIYKRRWHRLFIFGSFVNGRAKIQEAGDGFNEITSDIDVTFKHNKGFQRHGLRSRRWFFSPEKNSDHYRWMLQLENNLADSLNIINYQPGRLLAPMTDISPYQLIEMNRP